MGTQHEGTHTCPRRPLFSARGRVAKGDRDRRKRVDVLGQRSCRRWGRVGPGKQEAHVRVQRVRTCDGEELSWGNPAPHPATAFSFKIQPGCLPGDKLSPSVPCGQGTGAGVGVTRPALWPSCQAVCILELMRAEGGAPGPARLITGGQRPWGGPGYNGAQTGDTDCVTGRPSPCLNVPASCLLWESWSWGSEEGGQDVYFLPVPSGALSPSSW